MPSRNVHFVGREKELDDLHARLYTTPSTVALTQTQAIRGLGGAGKTALAIEYAHRYADEYACVLFTRADSETALQTGYQAIARELNLPQKDAQDIEAVVAEVLAWLNTTENTLLILDNADFTDTFTPETLHKYLPSAPKGYLLLTSRSGYFAGFLNIRPDCILSLDKLTPEEAKCFLCWRIHGANYMPSDDERDAIGELTRELDGLPLALEQAVAFIGKQGSTFRTYWNRYRKHRLKLLEQGKPETGNYPQTVATTYDLNFRAVKRENPASAELLKFSAFLASNDIPRELVITAAQNACLGRKAKALFTKTDDQDELVACYDALLSPLTNYSLVTKNNEQFMYSIHRMVQEAIQDDLDAPSRRAWTEKTTHQVLGMLADMTLQFGARGWERLVPHAVACALQTERHELATEEIGRLCNRAGHNMWHYARYSIAETLFLRVVGIARVILGEQDPLLAICLGNLATLYDAQGRYSEAEPLYNEALKIDRVTVGENHLSYAIRLNNLAGLYQEQGRYSEAEPLYLQALEIRRSVLPKGDPGIATSLNNLAGLYEAQGRYEQAEPLYKEALEIRRLALPEGHPYIAQSLNNLATLYDAQRRYSEAEPLHLQALEIRRSVLPKGHPDIAQSLNNVAGLYQEQGRYSEAEPLYNETLQIWQNALDAQHPNIATSLNNLGGLYWVQRRYSEAEALYLQALEIRRAVLPEGHPNIGNSLNNLAQLYQAQGRNEQAEPLFKEAVGIMERSLGPQHPNTQVCAGNLLVFLLQTGRQDSVTAFVQEYPACLLAFRRMTAS